MNSSDRQSSKIVVFLVSGILAIGGLYYSVVIPIDHLYDYYTKPDNPFKHEHLAAVLMGIAISAAFWFPVAGLAAIAKEIVGRRAFLIGVTPAVVLCVGFVAMCVYVLLASLIA